MKGPIVAAHFLSDLESLPVASKLLRAALLILPHCCGSRGGVPGNLLVGGSRLHLLILYHCTQPESISAQLKNEDKYYQLQPETLLCICVGAQELCNSTRAPSPTHRSAQLEREEPRSSSGE